MKRVWLVAAENDVLPRGKVGGVGDVVRDLPLALAGIGLEVSVITPSYGMFHELPGATFHREVKVEFAGGTQTAEIYRLSLGDSTVKQFVIEHPLLSPQGPGKIYVRDEPGKPFAIDSAKFAFFNAAVAAWVNAIEMPPDVLHLNDWHTGLIPALREFGDPAAALRRVRIVFTVHNLAYQGVRPFEGDPSSLESWFPGMAAHWQQLQDPRYPDCVNFMAAAIRLADGINTVSPSYALEILRPSDPATGFSGGEGLEAELNQAHFDSRLVGILNGCMYPEDLPRGPAWGEMLKLIGKRAPIMIADRPAQDWLKKYKGKRPKNLMLSIGRVVEQKVPLFLEPVPGFDSALEAILDAAGPESLFIMLGNGQEALEDRFAAIARASDNFLYLRGYADALSAPLYAAADLFLMPSSFEPCGISQMLAMRVGQPCVVHAVGGLKDTVEHGVTGFVFTGDTPADQAENFVSCVREALLVKQKKPSEWEKICVTAAARRFSWQVAALNYQHKLYEHE
ncbi:MAG: glycogen/starch synthase [Gammaproteobacteria bacterium]|nr:glycogen/starch synthase [Gammaproteobacteria bacterium]NNL00376.1 glycosyltransferase [Xanthomonadales bacterium]